MKALLLALATTLTVAPTPKAPLLCGTGPRLVTVTEDAPAIYADEANNTDQPGRVLVDGKAIYTFTDYGEVPVECEAENFPPVVMDPATLVPEPLKCDAPGADPEFCIDPSYDPNVPPGEGPPGAVTVDKPG